MNQEELKQRLIDLIADKVCNRHVKDTCLTKWGDGCGECEHGRNFQIGDVADHLIANGVTIRERARPLEEWGEDYGAVLWWKFPIEEPPYVGSPLDEEWTAYHTHWTPIVMPLPQSPEAEKGGAE